MLSRLIGGLCYRTERIVFLALLEGIMPGRGKGDQCLAVKGREGMHRLKIRVEREMWPSQLEPRAYSLRTFQEMRIVFY